MGSPLSDIFAMRRPWLSPVFLLCVFGLFAAGCAHAPKAPAFHPSAPQARMTALLVQRLELSRQVAWVKFQNNAPVRDPQREAALLSSLTEKAVRSGLPPAFAGRFFQFQMKASRQLQSGLIHGWTRGTTLPALPPLDLQKQIRPRLDQVSTEMVQLLVQLRPSLPDPAFAQYARTVLRQKGFPWQVADSAVAPLR